MLTKRIIPCLDVKDGRVVKGTNFVNLRDAGDPVELGRRYNTEGADELVFLDISATREGRKTIASLVERVAREVFIPFTVGGGISTVQDIGLLLRLGADKVAINSAGIKNPDCIAQAARAFGNQCIVAAIDAKLVGPKWEVFTRSGQVATGIELLQWATRVEELGAGEIMLTSIDRDGTKSGFDIDMLKAVSDAVNIPVIASGGGGTLKDFYDVFTLSKVDAALAASIFHFQQIEIKKLKEYLQTHNIPVRL